MITSAIIPRPLAKLPWRLIFIVFGIAGFSGWNFRPEWLAQLLGT